jgi:hypothetical protein
LIIFFLQIPVSFIIPAEAPALGGFRVRIRINKSAKPKECDAIFLLSRPGSEPPKNLFPYITFVQFIGDNVDNVGA